MTNLNEGPSTFISEGGDENDYFSDIVQSCLSASFILSQRLGYRRSTIQQASGLNTLHLHNHAIRSAIILMQLDERVLERGTMISVTRSGFRAYSKFLRPSTRFVVPRYVMHLLTKRCLRIMTVGCRTPKQETHPRLQVYETYKGLTIFCFFCIFIIPMANMCLLVPIIRFLPPRSDQVQPKLPCCNIVFSSLHGHVSPFSFCSCLRPSRSITADTADQMLTMYKLCPSSSRKTLKSLMPYSRLESRLFRAHPPCLLKQQ